MNILKMLNDWSEEAESKHLFPTLFRLLEWGSKKESVLISFQVQEGLEIYKGGWDAQMETGNAYPFIPVGKSFWELKTSLPKYLLGEADRDFEKRPKGRNLSGSLPAYP